MFDALGKKLQNVVRNLSGQGTISDRNITEALRDVRMALLEADVHFKVVKDFVAKAREKAVGAEVMLGVNAGQQFIKIVHDELVETMGGAVATFDLDRSKINVVMLLGLQGSGKTTFAAKLGKYLAKHGFKPMLVACDIYRPAAVMQLVTVGAQAGLPVFEMGTDVSVIQIAEGALAKARAEGRDVVILDTAGRLHIDEMKMDELVGLRDFVKPRFTFLVADAMTGQDAVNSAGRFHETVGIDGVCLTKMDGDARGGAALSVRAVTGRPIYFAGMGEQLDDLEPFYPDRMAQRILGMGDVLTLVEKAQEAFDQDEAEELRRKIRKEQFTFEDFLKQMKQMKRMGSMSKILKFIPGMGQIMDQMGDVDLDKEVQHTEAIIHSMTIEERQNPTLLDKASRRARIGKGCGLGVAAVNQLVREFETARKMMKQMMGGGMKAALAGGGGGMPRTNGGGGGGGGGTGSGKGKKSKKMLKKMGKKKSR
jgi:signal recognition particle subunit SRP54